MNRVGSSNKTPLLPIDSQKHVVTDFNSRDEMCARVQLSRPIFTETLGVNKEEARINLRQLKRKLRTSAKQSCQLQTFLSFFPFLKWMREYQWKTDLLGDFLAGLTVGIMSIPQGMAYARLAGMPPVYGLYSNIIPTFVYFFLGTAKLAAIGPATVLSLITASIRYKHIHCENCWKDETNSTNGGEVATSLTPMDIGSALAFLIACYLLLMGIFRLSFLSNFLPDQLVGGFTMAAAVQVAAGQISSTFGIKLPHRSGVGKIIMNVIDLFSMITSTNVATLIVFLICFTFLIFCKRIISPRFQRKLRIPFPGEFIVMVVATIASHFGHFHRRYGVNIVEHIEAGFPAPKLPRFSIMPMLAGDAVVLAIITYSYAISLAKLYAKRNGYKVDSGQEFYAYGFMNLAGSFFQCFNSGLTVARCMVYEMAGAKSQFCGMFGTAVVIITIVFLAQFLASLPDAALAAIIIAACVEMFRSLKDLPSLFRKSKYDFSIYIVTCLSVILLDVTYGLAIGVCYALLTLVYRSQRVRVEQNDPEVRRLFTSDDVQNENLDKTIVDQDGVWDKIRLIRLTTPWCYINAEKVKLRLLEKCTGARMTSSLGQPSAVILDMTAVTFIDMMGINAMREVSKSLKEKGTAIFLCGCTGPVNNVMKSTGFLDESDVLAFPTVLDAISYAQYHL